MSKLTDSIYKAYSDQWAKGSAEDVRARLQKSSKAWGTGLGLFIPMDRNSVIIDIGCGYGDAVWNLQSRAYVNVTGYDLSENQVAYGKQAGVRDIYVQDALDALSKLKNESVDCVLCIDVMEHMPDDLLHDFVTECKRVLKKNGRLVARVPNGSSPYVGSIRYGDLTHVRAFTQYSSEQLFASLGMCNVACHECTPIPSSLKGIIRMYLWKVLRWMHVIHEAVETGAFDKGGLWTKNIMVIVTNE